ncbi:rhodanese-like domain-containing protein [Streptosporangium sp. NPDC050855]|uniref:rhodanese-like domain-containing protein n=1 Tax=Streptosporangium sp. NPDC050855 TaxID=3366194 RepID=UPI003794A3DB
MIPLIDEGLGNSSYLVDLGDGRALAVDVSRDLRAVRRAADRRGLTIAFAADTHLHADFLSGARQLAHEFGTRVLASAAGERAFDHVGLRDGDEVDLGGLTLRALTTPGHTTEHLAFLLLDGDVPAGVFTGGSLIVGSAARTDLVAPERARELAHAQYHSLRRLGLLPDEVAVWPTHGAGSFCSAPPGAERVSTIGREKMTNPLLAASDADSFADRLLADLGSFPGYFLRLGEINRLGPDVLRERPHLRPLTADAAVAAGATVVDVRPVGDFARGHIPGSISIPLRGQFASWLGWIVSPSAPVAIVRNPGQDPDEILWQALKIGHENLIGEITESRHHDLAMMDFITPDQLGRLGGADVLDVRQATEFRAGHLPGADHIELGSLAGATLEDRRRVVMCGHGERAATAASLLRRAGHSQVSILCGGPGDWAELTGAALEKDR